MSAATATRGAARTLRALGVAPLLPPPPASAEEVPIDAGGLAAVRAAVTRHGVRAGLAPERVEDLVLAVNELATNSVVHGGGRGTLSVWQADAEHLVCEVRDRGRGPCAGASAPDRPAQPPWGSFGLWLVTQLCDVVEQRARRRGGTVMRVTMWRR